jgi:predicted RNA-binding protein with PUA-like domain
MRMNYWLFKSEPSTFSFEMLKKKGRAGTEWDGVRNYAARNNMRAMKIGDLGFFYHSNEGLDIVGIVEIAAEAHHDATTDDERWECVDIRAVRDMPDPPTLDQIKKNPKLQEMALVRLGRLSVQPVTREEWVEVCRMGGLTQAPGL